MRSAVVIPVRNDRERLTERVRQLFAMQDAPMVIVVDDGSADDTGDAAIALSKEFAPRLAVIRRTAREGMASAIREGLAAALQIGAEAVVTFPLGCAHVDGVRSLLSALPDERSITVGIIGSEPTGLSVTVIRACARALGMHLSNPVIAFRAYGSEAARTVVRYRAGVSGVEAQLLWLAAAAKVGMRIQEVLLTGGEGGLCSTPSLVDAARCVAATVSERIRRGTTEKHQG